jgi:toxin-antitoxin system, toxin component, bro family
MQLIIIKDDIAVMSKIYDNKLIASFSDIAKVHGTTKTRLWKEFKRIKRNVLPFNEVEDYHIIDSYDAKTIGIFENLFPKGYKYNTQTVLTEKGYLKLAKVLMLDKEMTETYIKKYFRNRELLQENTGSNNLENIQKEQAEIKTNENIKRRDEKMNSKLIAIADKEIEIKEYNGERIVTAWDIAELHERDVREVTQNFKNVNDKMILDEDYFVIPKEHISESKILIQNFIPNNVKEIILFTESGYLLLTKTFTDERSWNIQRQLVKSYFKLKELKEKVESGEIEIKKVNSEMSSNNNQLEQLKSIENIITAYKNAESRPEKLMIIEMVAQMTGNKNKFGYGMADGATTELREGTVTSQEIAEMMRSKFGLDENFTQGSVNSLAKYNNLTDERYRYLYYNDTAMSNTFRYYPDEIIPKLYDLIMDKKKKRYTKYGLSKPYHELHDMEIDDEDF